MRAPYCVLIVGVIACAKRFNEEYCLHHGDDPQYAAYCHADASLVIPDGPPGTYRIVLDIDGLAAGSVVLENNGSDELTASGNGTFFFATALATGAPYDVTVKSQPMPQSCAVASGTGVVGQADVTDIAVRCTPGIACGTTYCLVGDACCYVDGTCNSTAACGGVKLFCDDSADCPGAICCGELKSATQRKQAVCTATVADCEALDPTNEVLCDPAGDAACTTAQQCLPSSKFIGYHSCQ